MFFRPTLLETDAKIYNLTHFNGFSQKIARHARFDL